MSDAPMSDDAVLEAVLELREAAKKAASAIEPLIRWSMQLDSDRPAAIRAMKKVLATHDSENVILTFMAGKVLDAVAPEAASASIASRRAHAKRDAERELRGELVCQ